MKVKCISNTSTGLKYIPGQVYTAGYDHGGGQYEIYDGCGSAIISPLIGHYLKFEVLPEKNKK